ncbi:hydroxyethylthiazole kinase [Peptoniphilus vaginalis]|uniref:hydroxyethylthiazole kinase n=1 Tax=Peptoniphilus vaginalis TaxID=1756987 RepID=UPI0023F61D3E|nr:hydroxyethylthiazole kinase [Peptoniphilus vaginalis]
MKIKCNLKKLRDKAPLIHIISNGVTRGRVADFVLSIGASPMMAEYSKEVSEITKKSLALVLNMGMLNEDKIEAIKIAGKTAKENNIPTVLDPVGVASSKIRRNLAKYLLDNFKFNVIRGNFNEINYLAGGQAFAGIDSRDKNLSEEDFIELALRLNEKTGATVVVSGKYEVIANSHMLISIPGGHDDFRKISGLGDMESAMIGSLLATPMSNLKACAISAIFLRQLAREVIVDGSIKAQDIISKVQKLEEISGEIEILSPSYKFKKPSLYGISDGNDLMKIKNATRAGMKIYQLRDKTSEEALLGEKILKIKKEIEEDCLFILNDNLKLAKEYQTSLHLGQDDEEISLARRILGRDPIIGATAKTPELAIEAENMGASYLGSGAFFETETKRDASRISLETYKEIRDSILIPAFPIGGINLENLDLFKGVEIPGLCMSSGIFSLDENEVEKNVIEIIKKLGD